MTTTAQPDYPALIRKAGWEPEIEEYFFGPLYRATQGPFSTPWMATWQEVWNYIKAKK